MNKDAAVPFSICAAQAGDEGAIVALLRELADYERASGFALTEVAVLRDLIGENRVAHCDLVFVGDAPAAIVVWVSVYRSFGAARGLYVEDLYFRPAFRRQGLGAKLLARLAKIAPADDGFLEWRVLDWNGKAMAFYEELGARVVDDWVTYRLTGEDLERLAS